MLSESELYEDISYGLRLFRKVLQAAEKGNQQPLLGQCEALIQKYRDQRIEPKVMRRFACRLLQIITPYKNSAFPFASGMPVLEIAIQQQQFGNIFLTLHKLFSRKEPLFLPPVQDSTTTLAIGKIVEKVQMQFDNLKGINLDYGSFKSTFFESNSVNNNSLLQSCLARNSVVKKSIEGYHRSYAKKKKNVEDQKNKKQIKNKDNKCEDLNYQVDKNDQCTRKQHKLKNKFQDFYLCRQRNKLNESVEYQHQHCENKFIKPFIKRNSYKNNNEPVALRLAALYCKNDKKIIKSQVPASQNKSSFKVSNVFITLAQEEDNQQSFDNYQLSPLRLYKKQMHRKIKNLTQCYNLSARKKLQGIKTELTEKAKKLQIQTNQSSSDNHIDPKEILRNHLHGGTANQYNIRKLQRLYASSKNVIQ